MGCLTCGQCRCPLRNVQPSNHHLHPLSIEKGQRFFQQGDSISGVFILCQGKARLARSMENGKRQILLPFVKAGKVLGLSEIMLHQATWNCYAEALETTKAVLITTQDVESLTKREPQFIEALMRDMIEENRCLQQRLIDTLGRSSGEKLAYTLLHIQEELDSDYLPLKNGDLADLTGSTPVTICQQLSRLKRHQILNRFNGLLALDSVKLKTMVNML